MNLLYKHLAWILLTVKLIFNTVGVSAQIKVSDVDTKQAVSYALLLSDEGDILCVADFEGNIELDNIHNVNLNDTFEVSRMGYISKNIQLKNYLNTGKSTIYLKPKEYIIPEVSVKSSQPDYLILKGYFRSYQLDNDVPRAYMDGIVKYYISLTSKKTLKLKLLERRTFINPAPYESMHNFRGKVNGKQYEYISGNTTGPPYIGKKTLLREFDKFILQENKNKQRVIVIDKDSIGCIYEDSIKGLITVNADIISSRNSKIRNLAGVEINSKQFSVTESYKYAANEAWKNKSMLQYRTEYREQVLKSAKLPVDSIRVESIHEFYVLKIDYMSKKEFRKCNTSSFFGYEKTNYDNKFWELDGIPNVPDFIENQFNKSLVKY